MAQKLALQWSPEQISGWLKQQFPTDRDMRISYEAIYRSLFVQTRGVLKKELTAQLRTRRQMRHAKGGKAKNGQGHILDMVSIRERPAEAEDRAVRDCQDFCVRRFPSCAHEALFEHDGELRLRLRPLSRRSFPIRNGVVQNQI